jgi:hypothetical protein
MNKKRDKMEYRKKNSITGVLRGATFSGLLLCMAALLAGCSKDPAGEPGSPQGGVVTVSFAAPAIGQETGAQIASAASQAQNGQSPGTRAALAENTTVRVVAFTAATGNPAQANYVAEQTYYMSGGKLVPCTVDDNGSFVAVAPDAKMELERGSYDFYAITPALPLNEDKATVSVAHKVDYAASATKGVTVDASKTYTLTQLDRKCVRVTFVIKKSANFTELTALSVTPSGAGLSMPNLPAAQSVKMGADIPAAAGSETLTLPASAFTNTDATTATAATVLLPLAAADILLTCDLTYTTATGSSRQTSFSSTANDLALEKGKHYTFTLTLLASDVSFTVKAESETTISDWTDVPAPAYPCVSEGRYIVSRDALGYSGEPLHPNWTAATMPLHNEVSADNALSSEFEVAAEDCNSTNASGVTPDSDNRYSWSNALSACGKYTQAGTTVGQWRLPTIKELETIYAKKDGLTGVGSFSSGYYWSATEGSSSNTAWYVNFYTGHTNYNDKRDNSYVRCVRDVN